MRSAFFAAVVGLALSAGPALALGKVTFSLNWLADPEAGGYYQALVDGTYAKYGLDVTILPSGPESDSGLLLLAGKIDFFQGGDLLGNFERLVWLDGRREPLARSARSGRELQRRDPAAGESLLI
jgi:NitT/TauT family transport system substrate-binding protein